MDIVIAVGLSLSVMLATAVWVSDKLKTYKEDLGTDLNHHIANMVRATFTDKRRELWWADHNQMQRTLKEYSAEWFKEYAEFRDKTTERLDERETDIVNILAELERIKKLEDIDDDKFHSLDMQIAELTRSQQLLLRTILERLPLYKEPTTPVRRKR